MRPDRILKEHLGDPLEWYSSKSYPPKGRIKALIKDLEQLRLHTPDDYYTLHCLSDAYLILGDYENALHYCPLPEYKQKWSLLASRRINLKILTNHKCTARDLLTVFSKRITKYGLESIELVAEMLDILLSVWEEEKGESVIEHIISKHSEAKRQPHYLFNGTFYSKEALDLCFYSFSENKELEAIVHNLTRQAENIVREEEGLPRVGEGWIAETRLYYEIKEYLPGFEVVHHGSPDWLGRQHLDIYVPGLRLALEYQGPQHDKPMDYFGGQEAFKNQQKRDRGKFNLCRRHGIKIIYAREGYNLNCLKSEITNVMQRSQNTGCAPSGVQII